MKQSLFGKYWRSLFFLIVFFCFCFHLSAVPGFDAGESLSLSPAQKSVEEYIREGEILYNAKKFREALAVFDEAARYHPMSSEIFRQRARCFSGLKDDQMAFREYSKAISLDENNAKAWGGRSAVSWRLKQFSYAVEDAEKAMRLDPADKRYPVFKGMALDELGKYGEAIEAYGEALKLDPEYIPAIHNRSVSKQKSGDFRGAEEDDSRVVSLNPEHIQAYGNRGICRVALGKYRDAVADLTTYLDSGEKNSEVLANRALARYNLGDLDGAHEDARLALKLSPKQKMALEVRGRLNAAPESVRKESPRTEQKTQPRTIQPKKIQAVQPAVQTTPPRPSSKSSPQPEKVSTVSLTFDFPGQTTWCPPAKPDNPKSWPAKNMLWEKTDMPDLKLKGPKPMDIPLHLEFGKLTHVAYAAAITTAKEAMRLVYGIMTEEETRKYEEKWAPYYDYPTKEIIDYLNKLNPLLVRFLEARAGYTTAAKGGFVALCEAGMADGYGDAESLEFSWDAVNFYRAQMVAYEDAMKKAVEDILALGEMPNPFAIRAAHRKRFKEAVDALRNLEEDVEEEEGGSYYVMTKMETFPSQKASDNMNRYTFNFNEGLAKGSFHHVLSKGDILPTESSGTVTWTPFPRLLPASQKFETKIETSVSIDSLEWSPNMREGHKHAISLMGLTACHLIIGGTDASGNVFPYTNGDLRVDPDHRKKSATLNPSYYGHVGAGQDIIKVACQAGTPGGSVTFIYSYEKKNLTADQAADIEARAFDDIQKLKSTEGVIHDVSKTQMETARTRAFNLQYQIESATYFKSRAEQVRQELKRTTDKEARKRLSWQLLAYDADMHAAEDSRTLLETGQWVRTRTLFDDYNFMRMETLARETARKAIADSKRVTSALKMIKILPYPHKTAARKIFERAYINTNVAVRNEAAMRQANREIGEMARNYYSRQAVKEMERERFYKYLQWTAQGVEIGAGIVFIGTGGALVAGAGGSATMVWAADTLLGAAYGGATGYAAGGKDEALKRSLEWAGTVGFTLSQSIQGYEDTGKVSGMVTRGATALLFAKGLEYGIKYLRGFGKGAGNVSGGAADINTEEFKKGLEYGKQLCKNLEKTEWELAEALSKGGNQETIDRLTQEATDIAADINASWHAKYFLKQMGPSIVGSAYVNRIEQVYEKMMPELLENLEKMGYNVSQIAFAPTRNAANKHTVSMDLDLALKETEGLVITKNGKPVSLAAFQTEAQEALNKAYEKVTRGRSAEASFLNLTTSKHQEAFMNTLLLKGGDDIPWNEVSEFDIAQAGDVLRTKMRETGKLPRMEALVEQSRAVEKEMRTKFLPYLKEKIYKTRTSGNPALADKMEKSLRYWEEVCEYYNKIGRTETDPAMIWRLTQEVKNFTGGKAPNEVVEIMSAFWEGMARFTN